MPINRLPTCTVIDAAGESVVINETDLAKFLDRGYTRVLEAPPAPSVPVRDFDAERRTLLLESLHRAGVKDLRRVLTHFGIEYPRVHSKTMLVESANTLALSVGAWSIDDLLDLATPEADPEVKRSGGSSVDVGEPVGGASDPEKV